MGTNGPPTPNTSAPVGEGEALTPPVDDDNPHSTLSASEQSTYDELFGPTVGQDSIQQESQFVVNDEELASWAADRGITSAEDAVRMARESHVWRGERSEEISDLRDLVQNQQQTIAQLQGRVEGLAQSPAEPDSDPLNQSVAQALGEEFDQINQEAVASAERDPQNAAGYLADALAKVQRSTLRGMEALDQQARLRANRAVDEVRERDIQPIMRNNYRQAIEGRLAAQDTRFGAELAAELRPEAIKALAALRESNPNAVSDPRVVDRVFDTAFTDHQLRTRRDTAAQTMGAGGQPPPRDNGVSWADQEWAEVEAVMKTDQHRGGL